MISDRRRHLEVGVSVVVPCYNEEGAVRETVERVSAALDEMEKHPEQPLPSEMLFVNDGSGDRTLDILKNLEKDYPRLRVIDNGVNCGYGASLKRGIAQAKYDRVVITDADGTYPNERIGEFARMLDECDMVIGARTAENVHIPLVRRPAKWALLKYARFMSRADIKDINSGLRAIRTEHVLRFWFMLPDAFSFTTTITMAMHAARLRVEYPPIEYHQRVGRSSIKPVRDTLRFFSLVLRTSMYFKPLQVFGSVAVVLLVAAVLIGVIVKLATDQVPQVTTMSLFSTGMIFLGLGLIGDLINARRSV